MSIVHAALYAVSAVAPFLYLAAFVTSWVLLRPHGRRWQSVMDAAREQEQMQGLRPSAFGLLVLWIILVVFLAPLVRPDVFRDAPSEADEVTT